MFKLPWLSSIASNCRFRLSTSPNQFLVTIPRQIPQHFTFYSFSTNSNLRSMSSSSSISEIPKTHKVIQFHENSQSLDVLKYEDVAVPEIGDDDVLVKNKYAGVNFIEAYFRNGVYPSEKPYILGREASGVIAKVGKNVTNLKTPMSQTKN
ncbi:unnamed protein product [Ambrosiozyma monospora]|uniref:Unnamed protein product n=1 Tax=Ambrosiozyma monospora TaxID=43982 RepID=A0ACB5TUL5_AMBMO|nr:unnamed protein product [Ambrosiozyma monospora]